MVRSSQGSVGTRSGSIVGPYTFFFNKLNLLFLGPLSVDRFTEIEDENDVEVDVEQCSDSEAHPRTTRTSNTKSPASPSDEDRLSPEPAQVCLR